MFILLKRKTAGLILTSLCFFGLTLGAYNFALHPNMSNWEKEKTLVKQVAIEEKVVALTFDDGPDPDNTPALLEVLARHQARATFFIIGSRAEKQSEIVKKAAVDGHEIGNHSYSHADFNHKSDQLILDEIRGCNTILQKITGHKPVLFRPPGGYLSYTLVDLVKKENMIITGWSWQQDSKDWRDGTPADKIADHIIKNIRPGQIIILHDGDQNGLETVKAVDQVIEVLQKQGYQFITVSELLQLENK